MSGWTIDVTDLEVGIALLCVASFMAGGAVASLVWARWWMSRGLP